MVRKGLLTVVAVTPLVVAGCLKSQGPENGTGWIHQVSRPPVVEKADDPVVLPQTFYAAGQFHEEQGNLVEAAKQYRKAIAVNHDYIEAHYRLAVMCHKLGRFHEAIESLAVVVADRPQSPALRNDLGYQLMSAGRWDDAIVEFERALALEPTYKRAHINLGLALSKCSRFQEAEQAFRAALPEADVHYNMGLMYRGQRRYVEAAESFLKVLRINPNFTAAAKQLESLPKALATSKPDGMPRRGTTDNASVARVAPQPKPAAPMKTMQVVDATPSDPVPDSRDRRPAPSRRNVTPAQPDPTQPKQQPKTPPADRRAKAAPERNNKPNARQARKTERPKSAIQSPTTHSMSQVKDEKPAASEKQESTNAPRKEAVVVTPQAAPDPAESQHAESGPSIRESRREASSHMIAKPNEPEMRAMTRVPNPDHGSTAKTGASANGIESNQREIRQERDDESVGFSSNIDDAPTTPSQPTAQRHQPVAVESSAYSRADSEDESRHEPDAALAWVTTEEPCPDVLHGEVVARDESRSMRPMKRVVTTQASPRAETTPDTKAKPTRSAPKARVDSVQATQDDSRIVDELLQQASAPRWMFEDLLAKSEQESMEHAVERRSGGSDSRKISPKRNDRSTARNTTLALKPAPRVSRDIEFSSPADPPISFSAADEQYIISATEEVSFEPTMMLAMIEYELGELAAQVDCWEAARPAPRGHRTVQRTMAASIVRDPKSPEEFFDCFPAVEEATPFDMTSIPSHGNVSVDGRAMLYHLAEALATVRLEIKCWDSMLTDHHAAMARERSVNTGDAKRPTERVGYPEATRRATRVSKLPVARRAMASLAVLSRDLQRVRREIEYWTAALDETKTSKSSHTVDRVMSGPLANVYPRTVDRSGMQMLGAARLMGKMYQQPADWGGLMMTRNIGAILEYDPAFGADDYGWMDMTDIVANENACLAESETAQAAPSRGDATAGSEMTAVATGRDSDKQRLRVNRRPMQPLSEDEEVNKGVKREQSAKSVAMRREDEPIASRRAH